MARAPQNASVCLNVDVERRQAPIDEPPTTAPRGPATDRTRRDRCLAAQPKASRWLRVRTKSIPSTIAGVAMQSSPTGLVATSWNSIPSFTT
jgi:hypothetical protein